MKRNLVTLIALLLCACTLAGCCSHDWAEANCVSPKTCRECGETEGEALGHVWEEATCESPQVCTYCRETRGTAKEHEFSGNTCINCGQRRSALELYPEGQLRYDSDAFFFTPDEFMELYVVCLAENGEECEGYELVYSQDNRVTYDMTFDGVVLVNVYFEIDPETGRVLKTNAGYSGKGAEDEEAMERVQRICMYSSHVCYGAMTAEKWDELMEDPYVSERATMTTYIYRLDGLVVSAMVRDNDYSVVCYPQ